LFVVYVCHLESGGLAELANASAICSRDSAEFSFLLKGQFAQAFRWAIKLAILLKTSTFKKSK
jgi:hypothetical protein